MATVRDSYMNFKAIDLTMGGTGVLSETTWPTGLSIRGGLCMLIHLVEWSIGEPILVETDGRCLMDYAVSTRGGLATMPYIGDSGYIDGGMMNYDAKITTTGYHGVLDLDGMIRHGFLPPIPLAAAQLSFYTYPTLTTFSAPNISCRIGFTTVELDSRLYTEIAEVWGW